MENVKVIIWGLGAMGGGMADMLLKKQGVDIVGVAGRNKKIGTSMYDYIKTPRGDRPDVIIGAPEDVIKPGAADVVLLCTDSFTKEAFPRLRYRTRDICMLTREKCSCGRTHVKMCKPMGRSDDMLIIRGVNVFPSQIETVLLNHGYPANYQIIVDRVKSTDTLDVQVEMTPEMFTDNMGEIAKRQKELVDGLRSMLGLAAKVTLVAPKTIVRSEGKAVRVIDKRKI